MTTKERKQIKHSLKTNIDSADVWIKTALAGIDLGAAEDENTVEARDYIISTLKKYRQKIADDANAFLAEIDRTIDKLS